jgi:hypothetical protein
MNKAVRNIFLGMLFTPLFGYLYLVVFKLPKTILHFYVFITLLFGIFYILHKKQLVIPKFTWLLFVYATYRLFWLQISDAHHHPLTLIYYSILNYSILFIVVIIYNTHFTDKFIEQSIRLIKVTVILAAIASVIQIFDPGFLNVWEYLDKEMEGTIYTFRRPSIFGFVDSNELGLSFIPLASVLIGFLLIKKNRSYILFTLLVGLIALLSNGRYVIVGFLILSLQYLFYYKIKIKGIIRYILYISFAGFVLYFLLMYFGYDYSIWYEKRLFAEGEFSETTRFGAFFTFAKFFPQNPIFGTGVHLTDEIKEASLKIHSSQIHVGYLSHLVSYGIFGSFFLFGFWYLLAKRLYKTAKLTNYWGSFFAFLIYFWAQFTLVNYSIFFVGLLFALIMDKYYLDQYKKQLIERNLYD